MKAQPHEARTHLALDPRLCGIPQRLAPGEADVALVTVPEMAADERGLVHGGFVFGLADCAAMLAINEPTVVLGAADVRFLAPCSVGDELVAHAIEAPAEGKKRKVHVRVRTRDVAVFEGSFVCFVPARHVLDGVKSEGP